MSSPSRSDLEGQRALVTGATSGIGRAIALQLARDGAEVVVHGRDTARGAEVVDEITKQGGKAGFVGADLSDVLAVTGLRDQTGDIDILVNNAGLSTFGPTADFDVPRFDSLFESNVRAPFLLVAAFAPAMANRGKGTIVNVSSMAARIGISGAAAYGATKAALEAMTRAWAIEFSPNVRVNAVSPGPVVTSANAGTGRAEELGDATLLKRPADVAEVAEVVAFLVSSRSSYVTGAVIAVDGGRTAI